MSASPLQELEAWERDLLAEARVARLGLLDSGGDPRVLPVTFAVAGGRIWSAIDHKRKAPGREPARLRFLRERPRVALTADRYDDDWSRLSWVQALGSATLREAGDEPDALAALAAKYEPYRERPPGGPLIAIAVERVLSWRA
ncbi:MAG TPA: TIGR03668 family PPOX class F420-dependent oxidoreductase [Solirubrobacterales bacterium]